MGCHVDVSMDHSAFIFRVRQSMARSTITKRIFLYTGTALRVPLNCEFLDCLTVYHLSFLMTHCSTLPLYSSFFIPPSIYLFLQFFLSPFTRDSSTQHITQQITTRSLAATMLRGWKSVDRYSRNLVRILCQLKTPRTTRFGFPRSVIITWRTCKILR